jgi:hypothetical protein
MKKILLSLAALTAFAPAFAGSGTEADPYTVSDLLAMETTTSIDAAYVQAYIVGYAASGSGTIEDLGVCQSTNGAVASNVLLADAQDCSSAADCVALQLVSKSTIRSEVNLMDNPGNLGKSILVAGQIIKYFDKVGIKAPTSATLSGTGVTPTPVENTKVDNIAAFIEAANTSATFEFNNPVTVVYQYNTDTSYNLYLQDATGGLLVYGNTNQTYNPGDVIPAGFTGKYTLYNGCIELTSGANFAAASGTAEVNATTIAVEDISTDIQNNYVLINGADIVADDSGSLSISQDDTTLPLYDKFGVNIAEAQNINLYAIVSVYSNTLQLYPVKVTDGNGTVIESVAAPTFSVSAGAVEAGTKVELASATEGATIYYTLDGSEPTTASTVYSTPIEINEALTIKAFAVKDGMNDSAISSAEYTIKETPNGNANVFNFSAPDTLSPAYSADPASTDATADSTYGYYYSAVDVTFASGNARILTTAESGTGARLYYSNTNSNWSYRVYKNSTFTIMAINDAVITGIEVEGSNVKREANADVEWDGTNYAASWTPATGVQTISFSNSEGTATYTKITVYTSDDSSLNSVAVDANDAAVEYFNLQGVRVANPQGGIFIRRQGNKVSKVVIR